VVLHVIRHNPSTKENNEMALSIATQQEIRAAQQEAEQISLKAAGTVTAQDKQRFNFLMSQISLLKTGALSDESRYASADALAEEFGFKKGDRTEEARTKSAGLQSLREYIATGEFRTAAMNTVTGSNGGYLLPVEFERILLAAAAQYDDLMNPENVRVIPTENGRTLSLPSIDLSAITSAIVSQNTQQVPVANPAIATNSFGGFTYKTTPIAITLELEQDSFESTMQILMTAFGVGLARGIGSDLVNGSGSGAPMGLLTAAANSTITTAAAGVISATDIESIYFSVNRAYRNSPKCAWVLSDTVYQMVRAAKDSNNRPLLNMVDDQERLMGKRVLIAPSMPSAAGSKGIAFGDLSQFAVRIVGSPEVKRASETPGYFEKGAALYTGWLRCDSGLIAPGSVAPIVYATLHA
jgi:HK97 family phage major capsid protein